MHLRFLGPCESGVYIAPDTVVGADEAYLDGWQAFVDGLSKDALGPFEVGPDSFAHSGAAFARRPIRYETTTTDTPYQPPHVFDAGVRLDPATRVTLRMRAEEHLEALGLASTDALVADGLFDIERAHVRLYYGGIMNVWFETRTSDEPLGTHALEEAERAGIAFLQVLAEWIDKALRRFFSGDTVPWRQDRKGAAARRPYAWEAMPRGPAFWVSRSLIFERGEDDAHARIRDWLSTVSGNLDPLLPEDGFRMEWMRYAFDLSAMADGGPAFEDAWESMLFAQFFWSTLERIEFQMFRVLGRIDSTTDTAAVRESYVALGTLREAAELTLVHHRYQMRYLSRVRHRLVSSILKGWDFDDLVENLRDVIEIARVRHEQLLQRATARGNLVTDLLLFAIGSVAVLDFFVGLTVVGRQLASDSSIGRRDEGWFGLVDMVSGWRVNDVLSVATIAVVVALFLIAHYRRRRPY